MTQGEANGTAAVAVDTSDIELESYALGRKQTADNAQAFFAKLADSVRPGYVGDQHKTFVAQILIQAEAAGLYDPKATE